MKLILNGRNNALLIVLLLVIAGTAQCFAYDFSAVCETGQTLYYKITDADKHYVELINPNEQQEPIPAGI